MLKAFGVKRSWIVGALIFLALASIGWSMYASAMKRLDELTIAMREVTEATKDLPALREELKESSKRFDALDAKVEALDEKVEALDEKVEALDEKVGAIDAKVEALDTRVGVLEEGYRDLRQVVEGQAETLAKLTVDVAVLKDRSDRNEALERGSAGGNAAR